MIATIWRFRVQPEELTATWNSWQQQLQELDAAEQDLLAANAGRGVKTN